MAEVCYNQSDWDYRREEGVNQSSLKKILDSPAHYQSAIKNRLIPTPAMEMGTALHCLSLDGEDAFNAQYIKKPDGIKLNTKEGREWKEGVGRKKILAVGGKDDPWGSVQGMASSLSRLEYYNNTGPEYIKRNEVSIYWEWEGVKCKARLDSVLVDEGIVLDLKTTDSVDVDLFTKKVLGLGYDFQAAYYAKAAQMAYGRSFKFIFACIERRDPFSVDLFEVDEEMMAEATAKCIAALRLYKTCSSLGSWPNREPRMYSLSYPSWYKPYGSQEEPVEDVF